MPALHKNRVKMTVTSPPGTGAITLVAASTGHQSFATAYAAANATVDILISDGTNWEVARNCTYTHSGTTVDRGTFEASSTGSAVNFASATNLTVEEILTAQRGNDLETLLGVFGLTEIAVTSTTTATIGRMHLCTGTSSDYTVTLPAASGNAGKLIGFRMGTTAALTKFVTLDGNASETIDGALTRIMWSYEAAILLCDGSNWFKLAGKSVPMAASLKRTTAMAANFADGTLTKVTLDTLVADTPTGQVDTSNNRISIKRPGSYVVNCGIQYDANAPAPASLKTLTAAINLNGTTSAETVSESVLLSGPYVECQAAMTKSLSAGDLLYLCGQVNGNSAANIVTGKDVNFLSLTEIISW